MKKIIFIILCLLCTITASALSYASPYKGAGRGGYIYTTSAVHQRAASAGMAQAPVASMASTGRSMGGGIASVPSSACSIQAARGISTVASSIRGGVTTYGGMGIGRPRKGPGQGENPGGIPDCGCDWHDNGDGTYTCPICGCTWDELDDAGEEHCHCVDESGYCWCPLDFNWTVAVFFAILATAYAVYKKRTSTL